MQNSNTTVIIDYNTEKYTLTGNVKLIDNNKLIFIKGPSKNPNGIETVIDVDKRSKYTIDIYGNTQFSKGGDLYLWTGNLHNKMICLKPIRFSQSDSNGIGHTQFIIHNRRYDNLKICLYYRGRIVLNDSFIIHNIIINKIKRDKHNNDDAILILGDFTQMKQAVALNRLKIWEYIRNHNPRVYMFGTNHPKYHDSISIHNIVNILNIFPKIIIHIQYNLGDKIICRGLDSYNCKKMIVIEDMHNPKQLQIAVNRGKFNHIIYNCDCKELDLIKKILTTKQFIHIPHFIDHSIFKDYGMFKKWDIIFYGTQNKDYYPFRNRIYTLLLNCNKFNIKVIPFTGYSPEKATQMPRGRDLAHLINQSWIGIATSSRVDYFVKKYIEIPACNCMIAGNIPTRNSNILKGNIIELDPIMDDQTIIEIIFSTLQDKKILMKKITQLRKLIDKHYNFDAGYKYICSKLQC